MLNQIKFCKIKFDKIKLSGIITNIKNRNTNVEENEADRDACYKLTGDTMVPITTVNDKDYAPGFNKAGIDALLR